MKILGITMDANSTAAAVNECDVVACVSEERYNRVKNYCGYPRESVEYCFQALGDEIDKIVLPSINMDPVGVITHWSSDRTVRERIIEMKKYKYPKHYLGYEPNYLELYEHRIDLEQYPGKEFWSSVDVTSKEEVRAKKFRDKRKELVAKHLNISEDKIEFVEHHLAHSMYAYYTSHFYDEHVLVFSADGFGDYSNASVRLFDSGGKVKLLMETDQMGLGKLYQYITLILNMKPHEHEYKVMGLAPYASEEYSIEAYEIFKKILYVDGIEIKYKNKPKDFYYDLKNELEGIRFDNIAGGIQKFTEELLKTWVKNVIEKTGVKKIAFCGGVAMNIKAMMEVSKLTEIEELFVPPSSGDESLAIGACYAYLHENKKIKKSPEGLKSIYLGPCYSEEVIKEVIEKKELNKKYTVIENVQYDDVGQYLANGYVLGLMNGKMEFGARALGGRSILADPRNSRMINIINDKIKNRDFWMPFAPVIMRKRMHDYILNPKEINAKYMTIGFNTTEKAQRELIAGLHSADLTCRPQIIEKDDNNVYYSIIESFEKVTGVGGLLNTSFNLHGFPIVMTPEDAIEVFENSCIDMILLESTLVVKENVKFEGERV
ncbi:carbamoyltransferase C-terminal domain-containing protein [Clostridiaceae bacterium M8S5]|nr:carbamoyltransferase C-terminal domain-containing protein [Clostridiaceae bacterium M8S5]